MGTTARDLLDFLEDAELSQYYCALSSELKISTILQLKYVEEDDLFGIGMTKPEMRRLKRHYKKECPQGALGRLKKAILSKTGGDGLGRSLSPSPPENRPNRSSSRLSSYIRPPSKQIIPADSITINKTLGEGEFGVVQQGVWTTETGEKVQVAIKCLSKERLQNGTTEFLKEAGIMQTIDHENIVRMFGVVLDKENTMMLVTELAPMRSLLECLKEQALRLDFPLPRLCDFAQQICDGMTYLENKRLIHRDLAVRNILVFSKNKVKISDFGLSRALGVGKDYYQSNFSINLKLPIAWCAPECINYLKFTSASDVWAFGVTMWELFSYGLQPWASMTGQQILEAIDTPSGQRLDRPDLCPKEYYDLMCKCWDHDSAKRPTFSDIFTQLQFMRPVQMKALKDFPEVTVPRDFLYYKASDIIYVIDKNPSNAPSFGLCRGVLNNGKAGFFDPVNCTPIAETKPDSPLTSLPKPSISRKESKRSSSRKLRAEMISGPKNDLRHTGHIGYDGAVFGDVSFIGDNYDKLPVNVGGAGANSPVIGDRLSSFSLHRQSQDGEHAGLSLNGGTNGVGTNGLGHSWISQESINSTFKDEMDSDRTPHYQDIEDDSLFADFKMPDMGSSFDFGGSFMDEVLKALNEKEAKLEASSPSDSTPSPDSQFRNSFNDRSGSVSPPSVKEFKYATPPPLPAQPPRSEIKKEPPKPEPRKQAKVKPMSASEEKMMDDAIALANECAVVSAQNQTSETPTSPTGYGPERMRSDSESGSESPKLISKLKNSFKRSPKNERKRTFSEEIAHKGEITEDVPPEAQEAYNILVVRGSVKEDQRKERPKYPAPVPEARPSWQSRSESKPSWQSSKSVDTKHSWESSRTASESKPSWETSRTTSESKPLWETSRTSTDSRPSWETKKDVTNSLRSNVPLASTEEVELFVDLDPIEKVEPSPPRPVPKPRVEIPKKYEPPIPSPKQRPEIHRVDPVPRPQQPPPRIPMTSAAADLQWELNESFGSSHSVASNQSFGKESSRSGGSDVLRIQEDRDEVSERTSVRSSDYSDSDDPKQHSEVLRIDLPDSTEYSTDSSSTKELHIDEAPRRDSSSKSSSLFDEEFSEPSPREIMSKLARESRIRRSLDHQRGVVGDMGEPAPNRNLREPQGIPGKSMPSSNGDDEEVDTNPLRMLRGGAIPIRGGRAGQDKEVREKNCEEIDTMQKVFGNEVTVQDCMVALEETKWDVQRAIKYVKLKQLLSAQLGDVNFCKEALMTCDWDVQRAANFMLSSPLPSPECVDV
ncbi:tyrosine-protein kinase PR2-like isoform X1 [Mizuhopecten yessoensis]|uniref:tyrosine-protein kinase PR2-like isoform X1 n=1 Tax=Mizuhopecten yessoensis TaxID=6573 RepID=UPI000B45EDB1|nr:tyrosine-protein kinase PR2-like isoform X1 [Mizuhopecten yessoensis]XP_021368720.1 tyrosine-protein kinase PR2-like isoform X1 [Mizuhopecten yessoensis]XP_021368721.1 tyrosine-protein kinase PR2-like isoform X1 [Mizuhopecten yessoensis]XP_021368722.1 tyrosine-protein kinase PR2-like isoform X1 [Mizuhopecten yessoensis]XP_021368723.1 tyrosine-protein kinase PR2-like isoform X1 [Mizuhopecten yessoensis]XP_021368724.1 tyrosine-protein kinase PR2-like isoform X1 [Mizuhopecten yessoensis]XP_02